MNAYYEIKEGYILKTEFSKDFFGGHRTLTVGLNTKLGSEWNKERVTNEN